MPQFEYYNINFAKDDNSTQLVVRGEVTNKSDRDYNAVAIRVILFSNNIPIVSTVVVVNGLAKGRTKSFDKIIEELEYDEVSRSINRFDVCTESAY